MKNQSEKEDQRLELQASLDAEKTQAERNRCGQFATPTALANDILVFARKLMPAKTSLRFLDPGFGTGSFYSALLNTFPHDGITAAEGFEIDQHYGAPAVKLWKETPLKIHHADFTREIPPVSDDKRFNLVICNPPYVRHHHVENGEKKRLQEQSKDTCGISIDGLAGLYCYFLCLSHAWLAEDGLAGWLIPSEFMDVRYGEAIKRYLLDKVTLLRIHRFDPDDVQFEDALVSSAVVWFTKSKPPKEHLVNFTWKKPQR